MPVKVKAEPPPTCIAGRSCAGWAKLEAEHRDEWPWMILHRFAHSRVPFSAETLIDQASLFSAAKVPTLATAKRMVAEALALEWVKVVGNDAAGIPNRWVGKLTKS